MLWENIASQSAASASKATIKIASQALEDFLNEEEENQDKIMQSVFGSVAKTKNSAEKPKETDQLLDD